MVLKVTNGEVDLDTMWVNTLRNKPVLARNRERGKYRFVTLVSSWCNQFVVQLNLNHAEPTKRELFQNKDLRIGLSHSINRQEMINTLFQRQGTPWQAAPAEGSEFYDKELATQYTAYDLDAADQYLNRAGLANRDASGFRLGPDGNRLAITIETPSDAFEYFVEATELIVHYWKKVGIDARTKSESSSLFSERLAANRHDAAVWNGDDGGLKDEIADPRYYFPSSTGGSRYALSWAEWFLSHGTAGEQPPSTTREQCELYWQLQQSPDPATRKSLFREILKIAKEEFYVIGTVRIAERYGTVKNNFRNVPKAIPDSYNYLTPKPTNPEQYYIGGRD